MGNTARKFWNPLPQTCLMPSDQETISEMGRALQGLQRLHTISVTMLPEPLMDHQENARAIELLSAHCNTLRRVEVRWCRKDEEGYHQVANRGGLVRGQWAYKTALSP